MDCTPLASLLDDWLSGPPRPLELAAATRDVACLLQQAPPNPGGLQKDGVDGSLCQIVVSLLGFLRGCVTRKLRAYLNQSVVISPYAGCLTE